MESAGKKKYVYENFKDLRTAFSGYGLLIPVVKSALVTLIPIINDGLPLESAKKKFGVELTKNFSIVVAKVFLQNRAIQAFDPRTGAKLLKNIPQSASRKVHRLGVLSGSYKLFYTALKSNIFDNLAIFAIEQVYDLIAYIWGKKGRSWLEEDRARKQLLEKFRKNLFLLFGSIVLGACGFSIGTLIKPGTGTFIGGLIGNTILYVI